MSKSSVALGIWFNDANKHVPNVSHKPFIKGRDSFKVRADFKEHPVVHSEDFFVFVVVIESGQLSDSKSDHAFSDFGLFFDEN